MTFLIAEFMFLSTRWYKDLSDPSYGEVKLYSMSMIWIKESGQFQITVSVRMSNSPLLKLRCKNDAYQT